MKKFLCVAVLLILAFLCACTMDIFWGVRLTDREIYKLRLDYPFIEDGIDISDRGPIKNTEFRIRMISPDTYLYCEIMNDGVSAKEFIDGLVPKTEYYDYYLVKAISDTEGIFPSGTMLHICFDSPQWFHSPKTGDKIIIPVKINQKSDKAVFFNDMDGCLYYVTERGYAMSAIRESSETGSNNGYKAEFLVGNRLKKTEKEFEYYAKNRNREYEKSGGEYGFIDYEAYKKKVIFELLDKNEVFYMEKIKNFGIDKQK